MSANVDHVLVTRFNLPSKGHESLVRAQENWLKNRVTLFERYCLPSVLAQTSRQFSWVIYFDPESPDWLRDWVRNHERRQHFRANFREEVSGEDLLADISRFARHGDELLTTNLDNDDGLAADFVARLQGAGEGAGRTALYVGDGLIRCGDALYRHVDPYNAFCSVREPWDQAVTCWADWHNTLHRQMPVSVLRGDPAWLQVVHGANVSNRVHGRRTDPARHGAQFPGLLDDLPQPRIQQIAGEILVSMPVRAIREGGRATVKAVISKIAGRKGLDWAKFMWTSLRRYPDGRQRARLPFPHFRSGDGG
jgi:Putative rhamnosyl transferase